MILSPSGPIFYPKMSATGKKVKIVGSWKGLEFNDDLRRQGLLGIEELTNYSLGKAKKKAVLKVGKEILNSQSSLKMKKKESSEKLSAKKDKSNGTSHINTQVYCLVHFDEIIYLIFFIALF